MSDDEPAAQPTKSPSQELTERRAAALEMGGPDAVAKHHATNRLTVRERIALLIDDGTWFEIGMLRSPRCAVTARRPVTGW